MTHDHGYYNLTEISSLGSFAYEGISSHVTPSPRAPERQKERAGPSAEHLNLTSSWKSSLSGYPSHIRPHLFQCLKILLVIQPWLSRVQVWKDSHPFALTL